jgi:nitronate monooxygenase
MSLDHTGVPVVLAPLAGGPSTPELTAAVSAAGGLGFLAGGYLSAVELGRRIARTRELTSDPIGVNLFVPGPDPTEPARYTDFAARFREWAQAEGVPTGETRGSDDDWEAKLEILRTQPPAVVSFTFGCPAADVLAGLRSAGTEVWVSVTTPQEAAHAERAGAQALVVQGAEAGGHRASFHDRPGDPVYALLPLLSLVRAVVALPLIASGGIATPEAVAAVRAAGAVAAQVGTAFLLAPEAGTSPAHRDAVRGDTPTVLTRAFTGRLARGIRNRFIDEHGAAAPAAYPELHYLTAPMRRMARERGDAGLINLWAGEAHTLARACPAAEIVSWLAGSGAALPPR